MFNSSDRPRISRRRFLGGTLAAAVAAATAFVASQFLPPALREYLPLHTGLADSGCGDCVCNEEWEYGCVAYCSDSPVDLKWGRYWYEADSESGQPPCSCWPALCGIEGPFYDCYVCA